MKKRSKDRSNAALRLDRHDELLDMILTGLEAWDKQTKKAIADLRKEINELKNKAEGEDDE